MSAGKTIEIDVVVLSLNRLQDTLECIDSVLTQDYPGVHLWVLDQGSEPATLEALRQKAVLGGFSFVEGKRTGVAAGRNRGYRMGNAPVIVALDNDAILADSGVLTRVSERFAGDDKLGVVAFSVLEYANGGADMGSWGYPWPVKSHLNKEFLTARFCGAGHALSRRAFEASPGYDEQLFFFGEELDLSWWLVSLGYEIRYVPEIAVRHKSSQEQRIDWANGRYYYNVRNMLYLGRKFFHKPVMLTGYVVGYFFKGILNGLTKVALKGIWDGLRLKNVQACKPVLSGEALQYIMKYEFAPRGSAIQRFRREILLSLKRSISE